MNKSNDSLHISISLEKDELIGAALQQLYALHGQNWQLTIHFSAESLWTFWPCGMDLIFHSNCTPTENIGRHFHDID